MLSGADISSYQGQIDWKTFKNNVNFVIAKATEGIGFIDSWYGNNRQQARDANIPRGWYHFARPDLNPNGADEANYFLSVCYDIQPGELLCLDYETQWNGDNVKWVKDFFDTISTKLNGYKAIFYSYQSMLTSHDWSSITDHGLWVATASNDPNNTNFQTGSWKFAMMNQWGAQNIPGVSNGVTDSNFFYGDVNSFKSYGYQPVIPPTPPTIPPAPPVTTPVPSTPVPPIIPTPKPPTVPPTINYQAICLQIKGVVNETGWWWDRLNKIKALLLQNKV